MEWEDFRAGKSGMDDALARLHERLHDDADVGVVEMGDAEVLTVRFGDKLTVTPEEHEMKGAVREHEEVLFELVETDREAWLDVFARHGVTDEERREQLRAIAESVLE